MAISYGFSNHGLPVYEFKKGGLVLFNGEETKSKTEAHKLVYVPGMYSKLKFKQKFKIYDLYCRFSIQYNSNRVTLYSISIQLDFTIVDRPSPSYAKFLLHFKLILEKS